MNYCMDITDTKIEAKKDNGKSSTNIVAKNNNGVHKPFGRVSTVKHAKVSKTTHTTKRTKATRKSKSS